MGIGLLLYYYNFALSTSLSNYKQPEYKIMGTINLSKRIAAFAAAALIAIPSFAQNNVFSEIVNGVNSFNSIASQYNQEPQAYPRQQVTAMGVFNSLQGTRAAGLVIGMNVNGTKSGDEQTGSPMDKFNIGFASKIGLPLGFSLQPAIMYNVKKINLKSVAERDVLSSSVGFIEIPVQLQWGPNFGKFRPYIFGEPFVGYGIKETTNIKTYLQDTAVGVLTEQVDVQELKEDFINKLEYGVGAGAGFSIGPLQFSAKYYRNLGNLYIDETNYKEIGDIFSAAMKENSYIDGFTFSIGLIF